MSTITAHQTIAQGVIGLVVTIFLAVPTAGMSLGGHLPLGTGARDGRAEVVVVAQGQTTVRRVGLGAQVAGDVLAYRFRVEPVAADAAAGAAGSWDVRVLTNAGALVAGLHLTDDLREVTFPRPFGIRLNDVDSMDIVVTIPGAEDAEVTLRLIIEFDPVDQVASRLAVVPISASRRSSDADRVQVWEWTQSKPGRLLALGGVQGGTVASVTLVDVSNGTALWTRVLDGRRSANAAESVIRLGDPLVAGHTYRVLVTPTAGQALVAPTRDVVAMVLLGEG